MKNNYESYGITDFLEDEFFINWVKNPTEESQHFWKEWIQSAPSSLQEMKIAERQLRAIFSIRRVQPSIEDTYIVWDKIAQTLEVSGGKIVPIETRDESRTRGIRGMKWTWVAASIAVLLILGLGYLFIDQKEKNPESGRVVLQQKNDILPGTNKATLTLADGTKIVLDSAHNGAITKQGNVTIIKLNDGLLSYDPSSTSLSPPHGGGSTLSTSQPIKFNTITTPRGGQYQLVLADGSKIWLNAASSLRFPNIFPGKDRRVELTGEGYFEIAHNAEKPFYVEVGDMEVKVLGTHFNINSYQDENGIKATLLEGAVRVITGGETTILDPGQQALIGNGSSRIQVKNEVNLSAVIAWKNGLFEFHEAKIPTIMKQLSRWYNIDVEYIGNISDKRFNGKIYRDVNLSLVLKILKEGGINYKIEGNKLIVSVNGA